MKREKPPKVPAVVRQDVRMLVRYVANSKSPRGTFFKFVPFSNRWKRVTPFNRRVRYLKEWHSRTLTRAVQQGLVAAFPTKSAKCPTTVHPAGFLPVPSGAVLLRVTELGRAAHAVWMLEKDQAGA